jgi:hypothetical protein
MWKYWLVAGAIVGALFAVAEITYRLSGKAEDDERRDQVRYDAGL